MPQNGRMPRTAAANRCLFDCNRRCRGIGCPVTCLPDNRSDARGRRTEVTGSYRIMLLTIDWQAIFRLITAVAIPLIDCHRVTRTSRGSAMPAPVLISKTYRTSTGSRSSRGSAHSARIGTSVAGADKFAFADPIRPSAARHRLKWPSWTSSTDGGMASMPPRTIIFRLRPTYPMPAFLRLICWQPNGNCEFNTATMPPPIPWCGPVSGPDRFPS